MDQDYAPPGQRPSGPVAPKNIFQNDPSFSPPPVQQVPVSVSPTTPTPSSVIPPPKKSFPKIFIFAGVILILLVVGFFALKMLGSKTGTSGEITWWGLWEDPNIVTPLINEYESSHVGVKINYIKQSQQDYRERLTNALAKGTGPDIFTIHNSWVPMFRNDLDSLPASVMNPADYVKTFYRTASSDLSTGNSIVGIPLGYDALALYINEDILGSSGKAPPATWDDLRVLARELTIKNDKGEITQAGIALGRTENVDHWPEILALMMIQNNVDLSNPIGKNAEDALTFFTQFSSVDGVWDATLPPSTQSFAAGKLAMYIGPSWRYFEIKQANPDLKFRTVPIPQLPKDNPNAPDISYATYWAQGVWTKSPNKAAAWDFLVFLSTQDSLQKMYKNASAVRGFGEAYPRMDMAQLLTDHPILGSIISQAPGAQSWYLASRTFDGPTGINTQLANYFGDAVNAVAANKSSVTKALETCAQGVAQVLAQYRLVAK
jgi:ABC-type glycerol-3-phosphate transport system substrate-binding protein